MIAVDDDESMNNDWIGRSAKPTERFHRNIMSLNIANAQRDDEKVPLFERIQGIALAIADCPEPIDALFLLEAGRASRGRSWLEMTQVLCETTGLEYVGVFRANGTSNPFGKAVFIRRGRIACEILGQQWLAGKIDPATDSLRFPKDQHNKVWNGDYSGVDCINVRLYPVVEKDSYVEASTGKDSVSSRVIRDRSLNVSIFHFPMALEARLFCARWIHERSSGQLLMGDFNTFEDNGGPEMIDKITRGRYRRYKFPGDPHTFHAFPHDICTRPADWESRLNAESEIVERRPDGTIGVLFQSTLDHAFCTPEVEKRIADSSYVLKMNGLSDHDALVIEFVF